MIPATAGAIVWESPSSSTWDVRQFLGGFVLHRDVNERQSGPAERLILAEHQSQIAPDLGVGQGDCGKRFGANVLFDVGAGDEAYPNIGGHEALQQFARVQFHGEVGFQPPLMKELLNGVASMPRLRNDQGELAGIGDGGGLHLSQGVVRRRNQNQFIAMDENHGQAGVGYRQREDAEVHRVVDDRFQNFGVVGALDVHRDVGVLLLEVSENVGEDVQAGSFVRANNNLSARHPLHLGNRDHHGLAGIERLLNILLKRFSGGSERHFAPRAIEQLGADLFLDATNL